MLAARFQRPVPIIFGILFAILANTMRRPVLPEGFSEACWQALGCADSKAIVPQRRGVSVVPDKYEGDGKAIGRSGAFTTTLVAFFLPRLETRRRLRPWA
jgi:Ca2+/H+ antiporter, TMEM165/GDT1 family